LGTRTWWKSTGNKFAAACGVVVLSIRYVNVIVREIDTFYSTVSVVFSIILVKKWADIASRTRCPASVGI
jgi:hypothetical protein